MEVLKLDQLLSLTVNAQHRPEEARFSHPPHLMEKQKQMRAKDAS